MPVPSTYRGRRLVLAVALALPLAAVAQPAGNPIRLGESHRIRSAILNEDRELQVSLPMSYGRTTIAYPVLFMLDGSSHLLHATATVRFLAAARERIPEMIVVTIPNTNRNRDLTPGPGAVTFQRVIADEIIPWVERTFRAAPERVLMGHSLGGSFTVHTLLNRPELFDGYVAASAPVWRYEGLAEQARPGLARAAAAGVTLHLTVGEHENERLFAGVAAFSALIDSLGPKAPRKWHAVLPDEDHSSTPARSLYLALEQRYATWRFPFYEEMSELEAVGGVAGLERHYAELSRRFGFDAPPAEGRLVAAGRLLITAGRNAEVEQVAERYRQPYPAMAEQMINASGYNLLRRGELPKAIETFRRNVALFGESPNVHDSLAEALCKAGQREAAKTSFEAAARAAKARAHPRLASFVAKAEAGCPG